MSNQSSERSGRLTGTVAVITGGASGMGRATALRFLKEGASVVIADFNEVTGAQTLALAAEQGYADQARYIHTDVANEAHVIAMIELAVNEFGALDVVFNNAGVGGAIGPLTETSVEDWDYTFDVLVKGVFLGCKHAARVLKAQGRGGSIINTASIAGLSGDAGPLAYSAAKAAVINLSRAAAVELGPERIRVNAICPGFIATPLAEGKRPEATRRAFAKAQPWPAHGTGEHIAGAALFLASSDSEFVTGEALVIDGGLTAAGPKLSTQFANISARNARVAGITKGSTGEAPQLRTLDT
ncbi:MAG: SDR family NAD(P)-dependent oxidoreductase [Pseudomonadales bacterium]